MSLVSITSSSIDENDSPWCIRVSISQRSSTSVAIGTPVPCPPGKRNANADVHSLRRVSLTSRPMRSPGVGNGRAMRAFEHLAAACLGYEGARRVRVSSPGSVRFSPPCASSPLREARTGAIMPTSSHVGSMDTHGRGPVSAAISRAVVRLFSDHTGRGPTKARTTIDGDLVVVLLHDSMTHAEKTLVQAGKHAEVLQIRRTFQETMRPSLVEAVEGLTERTVVTFMSPNDIEPDAAAEIFVLDRAV